MIILSIYRSFIYIQKNSAGTLPWIWSPCWHCHFSCDHGNNKDYPKPSKKNRIQSTYLKII